MTRVASFNIRINLGTDHMRDPIDLAGALRDYSDKLMECLDWNEVPRDILDFDSVRVGKTNYRI